ncbi:transglutaminase-like cysteine peptidase [Sneathiella glossodoripedis]|uniref:transglutaminase-like cysteine peptidase n=1 Tax=Sneathiella glossodoripedis TaxID=418853 RepID=UPI00046F977B|nr:transglutaminase-like cysteine peptidase [Sneathiella glossodoripedis]
MKLKTLVCSQKFLKASVLAVGLLAVPHIPSAEAVGIFGFKAYEHKDLKPFPKWRKVLDTYKDQPGACGNGQLNACAYKKWQELVDELKDKPKKFQLAKVNSYINLYRYILDPINWGVKDYWAIPKEFFAKFGDCEDYAIVKYFTLRALGWKAEEMQILVLQDMNLRIAHAILTVEFENKKMVLDNQIGLVIDSKRIRHYRPIYAVNENGWWRYKPR